MLLILKIASKNYLYLSTTKVSGLKSAIINVHDHLISSKIDQKSKISNPFFSTL